MSERGKSPRDLLPHGPGLQVLGEQLDRGDDWLTYGVNLTDRLSVFDESGVAVPELGLEIMAQACGMLLGARSSGGKGVFGVVASVRSYEYLTESFVVGEELIVRVKPEMVGEDVVVCEGELFRRDQAEPIQVARIALMLRGEGG